MVELTELTLYLPQLPGALEGLRILHAGDLHTRGFGRSEKCLQRIMQEGNIDLTVFTGDFCWQMRFANPFSKLNLEPHKLGWSRRGLCLTPRLKEAREITHRLFEDFRCPLGVYAVQGNHDPNEILPELKQLNVTMLNNQTRQITAPGGAAFNLCGLRCYGRIEADIVKAFEGMDPSLFTIALTHYPDFAEPLAGAGADLILAGHTHGGQICLPGRRPLITHSLSGKAYATGLKPIGRGFIYTTRGLGYSQIPLRLFCPPEIVRITLRQGKAAETTIKRQKIK